jgi:hypothetical protein
MGGESRGPKSSPAAGGKIYRTNDRVAAGKLAVEQPLQLSEQELSLSEVVPSLLEHGHRRTLLGNAAFALRYLALNLGEVPSEVARVG